MAHRVDTFFKREFKARPVMLRKSADPKIDSWEVDSFARPQLTANNNSTLHIVSRDVIDHELHETVVHKNSIAGPHYARQLLEARRGALRIANDVFTR